MSAINLAPLLPKRGADGPARTGTSPATSLDEAFGPLLDQAAGRTGRDGTERGRAAVEAEPAEAGPAVKTPFSRDGALRSLAFDLPRGLPIRPTGISMALQDEEPPAAPGSDPVPVQAVAIAAPPPAPALDPEETVPTEAAPAPEEGSPAPPPVARASIGPLGSDDPEDALPGRSAIPQAAAGPLKATVVAQATHFAPALGAANLQAIADGVAAVAQPGRAPLAFEPALAAGAGAVARGSAAPVKILTIQLEPVSLGTVTVELRLTRDGMSVDLTASDARAAALLHQDKDLIVQAIRKSGVVADTMTIQAADPVRTALPQAAAPASGPDGNPGSAASFQRGSGQPHGRQEAPDRTDPAERRRTNDEDGPDRRADRGGVYL